MAKYGVFGIPPPTRAVIPSADNPNPNMKAMLGSKCLLQGGIKVQKFESKLLNASFLE
jgi:hypothetical protein